MQRHARPGFVAVHEARIRAKIRVSRFLCRGLGERAERVGHGGPRASRLRIFARIAVATRVGHPAQVSGVAHADRHAKPARRDHVTKRCILHDFRDLIEKGLRVVACETSENERTLGEGLSGLTGWRRGIESEETELVAHRLRASRFGSDRAGCSLPSRSRRKSSRFRSSPQR